MLISRGGRLHGRVPLFFSGLSIVFRADCGGSFGRPVRYTRVPQDERVDVYPDLIGAIRILIFNGDQDNCIPYEQDETWTAEMGLYVAFWLARFGSFLTALSWMCACAHIQ